MIGALISVNAKAINKVGVGKSFFGFLQMSCERLIVVYISKIFEEEKTNRRGAVKYELDSIEGILRAIDNGKAGVLDSDRIRAFVQKYGSGSDEYGLAAISAVIKEFRKQHHEALRRFKTLRGQVDRSR